MRAFRVRGVAGPAEAGAGRCRVRWAAGRQPGAPMPMGVGGPRVWARAAAAPVRAVRACRAPRVWCARVPDQSSGRGARLPGPGSRARLLDFTKTEGRPPFLDFTTPFTTPFFRGPLALYGNSKRNKLSLESFSTPRGHRAGRAAGRRGGRAGRVRHRAQQTPGARHARTARTGADSGPRPRTRAANDHGHQSVRLPARPPSAPGAARHGRALSRAQGPTRAGGPRAHLSAAPGELRAGRAQRWRQLQFRGAAARPASVRCACACQQAVGAGREPPAYLVGVRARPGCVADRGCALSARAAWPGPPRRVPGGVGQPQVCRGLPHDARGCLRPSRWHACQRPHTSSVVCRWVRRFEEARDRRRRQGAGEEARAAGELR